MSPLSLQFRAGLLALLMAAGCARPIESPPTAKRPRSVEAPTFAPHKLPDPPGIHNLVFAAPRVYSGSEPLSDASFAALSQLGIQTVVSVDGARPAVEAARRHGLRYVHIPIGYDGVPQKARESLTRLVRETDGPIYVHCHHGQHRGPAAAAVACLAAGETGHDQATALMELAGTGKHYPGLWRDVAAFQPLPLDLTLPELVEVAEVESFAAAMAKIDRNFDNLKLCQQAGWSVPKEHPDLVPKQEALILQEGLSESLRNLAANRPAEFQEALREAVGLATFLEEALRRNDAPQATQLLEQLEQSCPRCHRKHRNG